MHSVTRLCVSISWVVNIRLHESEAVKGKGPNGGENWMNDGFGGTLRRRWAGQRRAVWERTWAVDMPLRAVETGFQELDEGRFLL